MRTVRCEAIFEGGRIVLLARLEKDTAALAQRADIDSINIKSYDKSDPVNYVASADPAVADVVNDSVATNNGWTLDSSANPDPRSQLYGWNFRYVCPATFFPQGDHEYQVEATVTPAAVGATPDYQRWDVPTIQLFSH